ncbi:hypothetical protein Poly41_45700 [Novipirellula artificiosorum]|uniref:Uncharacterized protein n=1 Tax=Novipirellula artificiosorum TaxID=2528016 RepID=A0A5C6DCE7_9BACT|nr:hypothetical protein Poly41_45700 [Novipirellula artificiosorum]
MGDKSLMSPPGASDAGVSQRYCPYTLPLWLPSPPIFEVVRYLSCDEHSVQVSNHPCPRSARCTPHPNPVIFFWLLVRMCSMRWTGRGSVAFRSTRSASLIRFLRRCKLAEALAHLGFLAHPAEACAGGFRGISPVSHDCWQELFSLVIVQLPVETESSSAEVQLDKGYPGRRCAKGATTAPPCNRLSHVRSTSANRKAAIIRSGLSKVQSEISSPTPQMYWTPPEMRGTTSRERAGRPVF